MKLENFSTSLKTLQFKQCWRLTSVSENNSQCQLSWARFVIFGLTGHATLQLWYQYGIINEYD